MNDSSYTSYIRELVARNPHQMSEAEYAYITNCIAGRQPAKVLVFGVGNDSDLWCRVNAGGLTMSIENDEEWAQRVSHNVPDINVVMCTYTTRLDQADALLQAHKIGRSIPRLNIPDSISKTTWDVIIVDAPFGGAIDAPGRMQSIFEASQLSKHGGVVDIFIHDINRPVEKMYADYFFGQSAIQTQFSRLRHVRISSTSNNSSVS